MRGDREAGDLFEQYDVERPGFRLSEETRKLMLMLFVFSIIFFLIMYQRVYGKIDSKQPDDF